MKITDVKAMTLKGYKQWNYVQIETDAGLTGIGEAHPGAGIAEIILQFKKTLVGADPRNIEPLYHRMIGAASNRYAMGLSAIGGIETALWDLLGKSLGVPVYQLLGGKYRDHIRLYADVGHGKGNTPEGWAQRAREGVADGYQAIKFDIDNSANELKQDAVNRELSTAELQKMTALVAAAREAAGDGIDISIDCHSLFSTHSAMKLAERLEPFDLMFLEDPVPNDNVRGDGKGQCRDLYSHLYRRIPVSSRRFQRTHSDASLRYATCRCCLERVGCLRRKKLRIWRISITSRLQRTTSHHQSG